MARRILLCVSFAAMLVALPSPVLSQVEQGATSDLTPMVTVGRSRRIQDPPKGKHRLWFFPFVKVSNKQPKAHKADRLNVRIAKGKTTK
jgi:hypothetical protein